MGRKIFSASGLAKAGALATYNYADCGIYIVEILGSSATQSSATKTKGWALESKVLNVIESWSMCYDKGTPVAEAWKGALYAPSGSELVADQRLDPERTVVPCSNRESQEISDLVKDNIMAEQTIFSYLQGIKNLTDEEMEEYLGSDEGEREIDDMMEEQCVENHPLEGIICVLEVTPKVIVKSGHTIKVKKYRPLTNEEADEYGIEDEE